MNHFPRRIAADPEFTSAWLPDVIERLRQETDFVLAIALVQEGHPWYGQRAVLSNDDIGIGELWREKCRLALGHRRAIRFSYPSPDSEIQILLLPYGPPENVWIFGAGHIAQALAPLVTRLGWRAIICDDRAEYATRERFPDAHEVHIGDFIELAEICAQRHGPWIVLITRGHQHDERILRRLQSATFRYLGMIGSKRRIAAVRERLTKANVSPVFLEQILAPIGLPICADSPAEIAVSIVAEMISVRRGPVAKVLPDAALADTSNVLDVWEKTAAVLAEDRPAVLATIVERRGATPRGLGAQMAIFADGSTQGTIGGGCGEEEVKHAGKRLLLEGKKAAIVPVDLTGDPAAETADVCGGRYTVLLELMRQ